jgi:uncharacterized membrane protein YphA (DoxX/SURF4 family)
MEKPSFASSAISIMSFILGIWLVFDGTRKLVTGYYTGEQTIVLGPWATIVSALGVRPSDMAFPFVFLGIIWIVTGVIVLLGANTRYERAIAISILTLFYALPGTLCRRHDDSLVVERKALGQTQPLNTPFSDSKELQLDTRHGHKIALGFGNSLSQPSFGTMYAFQ